MPQQLQLKSMSLTNINEFRRTMMRRITKGIGSSQSNNSRPIDTTKVKRILIIRPNHRLGNMLLITPLVQEVQATFPNSKIDIFAKGGLASIIFKNYKNVDRIIQLPKKHFKELAAYIKGWLSLKKQPYDLVINVDENSSSGRLSTQFANSNYKVFGDFKEAIQAKYSDHEHMAKHPVYNLREYLSGLGLDSGKRPVAALDLKLDAAELAAGKEKLLEIVPNDKPVICLYTYATGTKMHSQEWWTAFYARLKQEYSDFHIIEILPVENVSQLNFEAPHFYSKDIREIAAVIASTKIFIGADSGMMHLASAAQIPTVGLFSVTSGNRYQPYDNGSIAVNTNETNTASLIKILDSILRRSYLIFLLFLECDWFNLVNL
jgi:heptosyltransferase-3